MRRHRIKKAWNSTENWSMSAWNSGSNQSLLYPTTKCRFIWRRNTVAGKTARLLASSNVTLKSFWNGLHQKLNIGWHSMKSIRLWNFRHCRKGWSRARVRMTSRIVFRLGTINSSQALLLWKSAVSCAKTSKSAACRSMRHSIHWMRIRKTNFLRNSKRGLSTISQAMCK